MIARIPGAAVGELINVALTREQVKTTVWALKKRLALTVEAASFPDFSRDCPALKAEHDAQRAALASLLSALDQQLSSYALPPASPGATLGAQTILALTTNELFQVELGLEERIDTLQELVDHNNNYVASEADVEDWREQIDVATALLERLLGSA